MSDSPLGSLLCMSLSNWLQPTNVDASSFSVMEHGPCMTLTVNQSGPSMVCLTLIAFKIFITSVSVWENGRRSHMLKLFYLQSKPSMCTSCSPSQVLLIYKFSTRGQGPEPKHLPPTFAAPTLYYLAHCTSLSHPGIPTLS